MDTLSQVVNDEPPPPRSLNSGTPVDLESICLKCLEKDPARRYPTARELETDLGRFLEGEPVQARPANALRRTMSWFRRHRWVLGAAVSALILTLAGLAYGLWEQTRFIIWLNAHPGFVKTPVQRVPGLDLPSRGVFAVMLVGAAAGALVRLAFKTVPSARKLRSLLTQPRAPGVATAFEAVAFLWHLFLIAAALFLVGESIHGFVWTGELPGWFWISLIILVFHGGVTGLMRIVREQLRIRIEPRPELKPTKPAPLPPEQLAPIHEAIFAGRTKDALVLYREATGDPGKMNLMQMVAELKREHPEQFSARDLNALSFLQGGRGWVLLGVITLVCGLWMLCFLPSNVSRYTLFPLYGGLAVGVSIRFAVFLLGHGIGTRGVGADTFGVAGWKRAYRGMLRWMGVLARFVLASLALVILTLDAFFLIAAFTNGRQEPDLPHGKGFFICGLVFSLLLIHLAITRRKPKLPRPEAKPAPLSNALLAPLSPAQLAPIHEAIFAGRTNDAFKLYHAAKGAKPNQKVADMYNLRKMQAELMQANPEKFSAGVLNRRTRNATRWTLISWCLVLLMGLWMLLFPHQSLEWLIPLFCGLGLGAFIRAMSSNKMSGWKSVYRGLRPTIKVMALMLVAFFAFAFAALFYSLIIHPNTLLDPGVGLFAGGLVAGWLAVHWSLKKRKGC